MISPALSGVATRPVRSHDGDVHEHPAPTTLVWLVQGEIFGHYGAVAAHLRLAVDLAQHDALLAIGVQQLPRHPGAAYRRKAERRQISLGELRTLGDLLEEDRDRGEQVYLLLNKHL